MILPQCIPGELGTPKVSPVSLHYSSASPFLLPLSEFLIPKQVMRGRRFLPMHIYSSASFHHSQ